MFRELHNSTSLMSKKELSRFSLISLIQIVERRTKWRAEKKGRREGVEGTTSIPSQPPPPPSTPSLFICSLFVTLSPLFWACSHESGGTRAVHKVPPPLFKPIAVFLLTFLCAVPTILGLFTRKWGNPGCPSNPPPLQPHRCFSANFSLRCPHYYGAVYMKVGEPGLSIKSRIFIWSRLHDRWGDHMRDYMERRVTSPTWGPLYLRVNTPFKAWSRLCS